MKLNGLPVRARPLHGHNFFRDVLDDFYTLRRSLGSRHGDVWQPPTDIYETDKDLVIKMCIPGIKTSEVAVEVNGDAVTICGVRKGPDPGTVLKYHQMEIRNGYFERRLVLHIPFDPDRMHAEYRDGFAYVFIPKAQESVRHIVSIRFSL
jgi:HSP20 family protein